MPVNPSNSRQKAKNLNNYGAPYEFQFRYT